MNDTQVSVVLTDRNRQLIWCNDNFLQMTGYSFSELVGKVPGRILQGIDTEEDKVNRLRQAFRKLEPVKETLVNYKKNGEAYPCSLVIYPIFDISTGELMNFIAFEVDGSKVDAESLDIMKLKTKYGSSNLNPVLAAELYLKLNTAIDGKIYLNEELTIGDLAGLLETNTRYLSQVIHENYDMNFNRFVNIYRVKHCKKLIQSGILERVTIEALANESGFRSKTAFYNAFRDETGMTPTEFLKESQD